MNTLTEQLRASQPGMMQKLCADMVVAPHRFTVETKRVAVSLCHVSQLTEYVADESLPPDIRKSVFDRRVSFVGGRLCAEAALAGLGLESVAVGRQTGGAPIWPTGVTGSITHTNQSAYAVVSSNALSIGIDTEEIFSDAALNDVRQLCLTRNEIVRLDKACNRNLIGTLIFSIKESFYKAIHPHIKRYVEFSEIELISIDWHRSQIQLKPPIESELSVWAAQSRAYFCISNNAVHTSIEIVTDVAGQRPVST